MGSSCGNGSPKANTSPQDIDLQHDSLKSKLKYGSSNLNFMVGLVAKKGASAAASSFDGGMLPAIFKKKSNHIPNFCP